ncbi:hypothetical protein [Fusobacterium ulcerans]|uniref:hypothetical protein n=1 Tax=Fusobacterium ulcerans TaxID=861 RepID=UPI001D0BB4FD|nr:hypothetical protein [Fusobacterium ulcerans]MCB8563715.1 hypothetical protein [Fusobacterium ulcerans]MCB8649690.1 hypothetical protein [Fusobacterium ulcerans]
MLTSKDVFAFLENEIKNNYKTKVQAAAKIGITRQELRSYMKRMENNGGNFNSVSKILDSLGFEVHIKRKINYS